MIGQTVWQKIVPVIPKMVMHIIKCNTQDSNA